MPIQLTSEQWESVGRNEQPVRVSTPSQAETFVLLQETVYERLKALFEAVPVTQQERIFQLQQFGQRARWDDPAMDIYDDLDPRRI